MSPSSPEKLFYLALKGMILATLNVQFWGKPKKKKVYNGDKILH